MSEQAPPELVGVVPAAGRAQRVAPLPGSKELFPVGFYDASLDALAGRPKPVCAYLIEQLRTAHAAHALVIVRAPKWDIPAYLTDGSALDLPLAYIVADDPRDTATSIDQAHPFVNDKRVALGFPDIVVEPADVFTHLSARQTTTRAEVVLGLFPTGEPQKMDMVEVDAADRVTAIVVKPKHTTSTHAWVCALWTPTFTAFLRRFQQERHRALHTDPVPEVHIGEVVAAALDDGMHVDSVTFADGRFVDIGTPEDLERAVRAYGHVTDVERTRHGS